MPCLEAAALTILFLVIPVLINMIISAPQICFTILALYKLVCMYFELEKFQWPVRKTCINLATLDLFSSNLTERQTNDWKWYYQSGNRKHESLQNWISTLLNPQPSPIRGKFCMQHWTNGCCVLLNFILTGASWRPAWPETTNLTELGNFVGSPTSNPLHRSAENLACNSKAMVCCSMQNFTSFGTSCCSCCFQKWQTAPSLDFGITWGSIPIPVQQWGTNLVWDCEPILLKSAWPCTKTRMWANAQHDGHPAKYRWRHPFNAAKFGWLPLLECCAVTLPRRETQWNLHECPKLLNWSQPLVGRSSPYCETWGRYCCLSFCQIVDMCLSCEDGEFLAIFASCIFTEQRAACFRPAS